MESLKIVALCVVAGVVYGILHDEVTVRVCLKYFTVYHPDVFHTQSPTVLALGWGIVATWWVGLGLGLGLALAARAGSAPKLSAVELSPKILKLLVIVGLYAVSAGILGYYFVDAGLERNGIMPPWPNARNFYTDLWAHSASYVAGIGGGIILCFRVWRSRRPEPSLAITNV